MNRSPFAPVHSNVAAFIAAPLLLLMMVGSVTLGATRVTDDGKFFSPAVVQQVEKELATLSEKTYRSVVVRTFNTPPQEIAGQVQSAGGGEATASAFRAFAEKRREAEAADVYILINRSPAHLRVSTRNVVRQAGLTDTVRDRIAQGMLAAFKAKEYDRGLTEAVAQLNRTLSGASGAANDPLATAAPTNRDQSRPAPASPGATNGANDSAKSAESGVSMFGSLGCLGPMLLVFGVIIVFSIVRRIFGARRNQGPGQGPYDPNQPNQGQQGYAGQGGGGFGRGLAGGLLGGMLGGWLGNQAFGGQSSSSNNDANDNSGAEDSGFSNDSGGDFSSSGDSGGDSSGGDF